MFQCVKKKKDYEDTSDKMRRALSEQKRRGSKERTRMTHRMEVV